MELEPVPISNAASSPLPAPTLSQLAEAQPKVAETNTPHRLPIPDMFSKYLILEGFTHWLFRLGFASIFLVNAVYATFHPLEFTQLLQANPISNAIGYHDFMVRIAMVNDLLLGIFILGGWRKKFVYAAAGAWLLLVASLKLMNLIY